MYWRKIYCLISTYALWEKMRRISRFDYKDKNIAIFLKLFKLLSCTHESAIHLTDDCQIRDLFSLCYKSFGHTHTHTYSSFYPTAISIGLSLCFLFPEPRASQFSFVSTADPKVWHRSRVCPQVTLSHTLSLSLSFPLSTLWIFCEKYLQGLKCCFCWAGAEWMMAEKIFNLDLHRSFIPCLRPSFQIKGTFTDKKCNQTNNPFNRGNLCGNMAWLLCGPMYPR